MNIDEFTGATRRESTSGIKKDEEEENDIDSDLVSEVVGTVCSTGSRI